VACMGKVEFLQNPGWEISREITVWKMVAGMGG
jgi:hypothetical protein